MTASTERCRVLWVIKGLGPGGAERLLVAAASTHDREQFDLAAAYLLPAKDQLVGELEALDVPCTCLGLTRELDPRWAVRLRRHLRAHPVDILHMHSPYAAGFARFVARSLPRRLRPHLVTTEHNPWTTYRQPTRLVNAVSAPLDEAVIAVSEETRASLPKRRRARTVAMAHGVPVERIRAGLDDRAEVRNELDLPADAFVIGTVANYHRKKDWPTLLRAARIAADARPGLRFLAVGQGPLAAEVEQLHRELGLEDVVVLTGYRPDAARLMASVDVFVLATRWEGLPVALMEACALGLPIVASAVGGIPEHFTDEVDALLVPAGDPQVLADALLRLVDDDALRGRLAAASATRGEAFDARGPVAQIEAIYRSLLESDQPPMG